MNILSIGPLPNDDITELFNDDGSLFGLCFEPSPEWREAAQAQLLTLPPIEDMVVPHWRAPGISDFADRWSKLVLHSDA